MFCPEAVLLTSPAEPNIKGEKKSNTITVTYSAMADQKYKTARQKPEYVYLDQLNAESKTYIVRVVVAEKGRDTLSSKKTVRFQTLLLRDEKGNRMCGTLFGDQIEAFEEALQYLGEYDISAAPIKFIDEKWRTELDQFPYQMAFGSRTVIQPVHPELGPILPNYQPIASIPRTVDPDEKYDIVGVVLYVEEEPRKIEARDGKRESFVREIVVTDESCDQPLTISLWNDLTAPKFFDKLPNWAEAFQVIGFRALKPYTRRGFSMNSGMSTRIIYKPEGDRARELFDWANLFHQKILDRQTRVLEVKYPGENKKIVSIAELRRKKPSNTIQEELLWIEVTIQTAGNEPTFHCRSVILALLVIRKNAYALRGQPLSLRLAMAQELWHSPLSTMTQKDCLGEVQLKFMP
ncbi:uncharacterized protein LOC110725857 [Chenopodium quinoa]|uniref:uncharacterized protein LOC110725857 n=1 Tax=Chenopodium quinoa TaxID=63459 RepID=UPI000B780689|nr:uncharacterized protein LOC110725857 [Chenopodium quinoa]